MHPRQSIIELFSTFVQFQADCFSGWVIDPRLRRSMETRLNQTSQPEDSEQFWALYWYNTWHTQASCLAKEHLIAYLQEPCYWTAQKTATTFANNQYTLSDCFQIAIAQIDKVLKGFNPNQGYILKNYANAIFGSVIRDTLRQRHEVDICTPWGLLRKLSQKRLVESLQATGLPSETITAYVLAWTCFKTLYVPTVGTGTKPILMTRQLSKPDEQTLDAIASLYSKQSHQKVKPDILANWLLYCAKAARNYLYPPLTSIHTPSVGQDFGELLEYLPGTEHDSLLSCLITYEEQRARNAQQVELHRMLAAAVAQLEPQVQQMLQLYYGQGLIQHQIAQQLNMKQYTVSRRLTKARESLLLVLAQWTERKLHISLTSDVLKRTSTVLEEWLQAHYNSSHSPPRAETPS